MPIHASVHGEVERLWLATAETLEVNVAQQDAVILLVGKPGQLRDALQSLVGVMPGLDNLVTADTGLLALNVMSQVLPTLVLVGNGLPDAEIEELLRQVKARWPETGCLVLTDSAQGRRQALAAGADGVLPVGSSAGQLFSAINQILQDSPEPSNS
jgi:DNA-binding NarL/FixJ family response regulator